MDFDTVAEELYALPLEQFTATRNVRAKQARGEGERPLADAISSLEKPTLAAWLTNQLVRTSAGEIELLLDLGRELREVLADVDGDELRDLTRQRYRLVSALVEQARSLGQARGRRVTDEVAQSVRSTLEATLSDSTSAQAVAAARLAKALDVSGFSVDAVAAGPSRRVQGPSAPDVGTVADLDAQRRRHERQQAERDLARAEKAVQRARVASDRARERLRSVQRQRDEATAAVDRLKHELELALADLELHERAEQVARTGDDEAQLMLRQAEEECTNVQARLQQLAE